MSNVTCDVCGTIYPETASQCPICGNAKSEAAATGNNSINQTPAGYAYVKGGRFSHTNVKKRNNGNELPRTPGVSRQVEETPVVAPVVSAEEAQQQKQTTPVEEVAPPTVVAAAETPAVSRPVRPRPTQKKKKKKDSRALNVILMIFVVILVLAIVGICVYLTLDLLDLNLLPGGTTGTTTSQSTPATTAPTGTNTGTNTEPTGTTSTTAPFRIPCEEIWASMPSYTFTGVGQVILLEINKIPANTTDEVVFVSSDSFVASVNANGKIVAVANGTAIITVRCGDAEPVTIEITCRVGVDPDYPTMPPDIPPTTQPTEPTTNPTVPSTQPTTQPTTPEFKLELVTMDTTLYGYGAKAVIYRGEVDASEITWTSSDEAVATVIDGIVKAVGNGTAVITAEYQGQRAQCIVRCMNVVISRYELRVQYAGQCTQVTMKVGEKLWFYLYDTETGEKVPYYDSEIYVSDETYITVDEYGFVTAVAKSGQKAVYIYFEHEGIVYKCQVIVIEAPTA